MELVLFSVIVMSIAFAGMAVGVIFSNKVLKGSCGGLGKIFGKDCQICEHKDKCEEEEKPESFSC